MSSIRIFTDEDVYAAAAPALRKRDVDAISAIETGRLGNSDESQLAWSADNGRVFVTFNVRHFAALHGRWLLQGKHHAGIVVSSQRPLGDLVRRLVRFTESLDAEAMQDRLEFLGDWWSHDG